MTESVPVLVVDDHAVMAHALAAALRLQGFGTVESLSGTTITDDAILEGAAHAGDGVIVVLDLHLGGDRHSTPAIAPLVDQGARVLVLTAERDPRLLGECLEAGALGVFDKSQAFDQLVDQILDAAAGRSVMSLRAREDLLTGLRASRRERQHTLAPFETLTPRERDALAGLLAGRSAQEIASGHHLGLSTVRTHVKTMMRKLGVNSQLAAVALARDAGWRPGDA